MQRAEAAGTTTEALMAAKELCNQLDQGAEVPPEVIWAQKRDLVERLTVIAHVVHEASQDIHIRTRTRIELLLSIAGCLYVFTSVCLYCAMACTCKIMHA